MTVRRWFYPCFLWLIVLGGTAGAAAEPGPSAPRYLAWLDEAIERQAAQMAAFSRSADAAAGAFVAHDGWSIGIIGQHGFAGEASGRAGGIIRIHVPHQVAGQGWAGVILVGLIDEDLEAQIEAAGAKKEAGCHVVAFGTPRQKAAAIAAGVTFDSFIETGAAETDGLVSWAEHGAGRDQAVWLLPTQHVANMVALWTWTGEFVAAVTRRGQMTPMYLAYAVPGGQEWRNTINMTKFHGEGLRVEPVGPGTLGHAFIAALREDLDTLKRTQLGAVRKTAAMAMATRRDGGRLFTFLHGHAFTDCIGRPHDPGYFAPAHGRGNKLAPGVEPRAGDMVFCVGFDQLFDSDWFNPIGPQMRDRGVRLAWSIGVNNPMHDYAVPEGEPVIDQCWPFGDASVAVPGYPIKILPTSGVLGQTVIWLVQAEMLKLDAQ